MIVRVIRMRVDLKRYVIVLVILLVAQAIAFAIVFVPRPAIDDQGWIFLESQRPLASDSSMFVCNDCLSFAVFRRGIGGWESTSAEMLQWANLPGFMAAEAYFSNRQRQPTGTSKEHSDAATLILVTMSVAQCAVIALLFSFAFPRA